MGVGLSDGFARLYGEADFADAVRREWMPWLLTDVDLGTDVLDVVVGPGVTVPSLRAPGRTVTVAQAAPVYTESVAEQYADVTVIDADPWRLPYADDRFSAATAVLALHHVPSADLQDQTLRELARVLRPGGTLAGLNAIDGPHFRRMNTDGACVPVEPLSFADRVRAAGFTDVIVTVHSFVRFTGRAPARDARKHAR